MTLSFPARFNPLSTVVAQPAHTGLIADEELQLAEMRQALLSLPADASDEEVTELVDRIEALIQSELPPGSWGMKHTFTPGLYGREIFMPESSLLTSRVHATEHQFVILSGLVAVWSRETGSRVYAAPFEGVTPAGTRRILYTLKDTRWKTFHANPDNLTDPDQIVEAFTRSHHNPFLKQLPGGPAT